MLSNRQSFILTARNGSAIMLSLCQDCHYAIVPDSVRVTFGGFTECGVCRRPVKGDWYELTPTPKGI